MGTLILFETPNSGWLVRELTSHPEQVPWVGVSQDKYL